MIKSAALASKRLSFRVALPVLFSLMLLAPWSVRAQAVSDAEMLQGNWRLSEIKDGMGDRSGDIAELLYVSTMSFHDQKSDAMPKVDLFLAPIVSVSDTLFLSGDYIVNEDKDSLTVNMTLGGFPVASLPSSYAFSDDGAVTFSVDTGVVNGLFGAFQLASLALPNLKEFFDKLKLAPDGPFQSYEGGTVDFTYRPVAGPEKFLGKWELSSFVDESGASPEDIAANLASVVEEASLNFLAQGVDKRPGIKSEGMFAYYNPEPEDAASVSVWELGLRFQGVSIFELNENNNWSTYSVDPGKSLIDLLMRPQPPAEHTWTQLYYAFEDDSTVVFTVPAPLTQRVLIPLWNSFKQILMVAAPALELVDPVGSVRYTFEMVDEMVTSADRANELPETATLAQNYPNPFNPSTEITWRLEESGHVRLDVFDMTGRRVATLVDGVLPQGEHAAQFNAEGLSTGSYVYRLMLGNGARTLTRTMTLIR